MISQFNKPSIGRVLFGISIVLLLGAVGLTEPLDTVPQESNKQSNSRGSKRTTDSATEAIAQTDTSTGKSSSIAKADAASETRRARSQTTLRLLQENEVGGSKRLSPDGTKMAYGKDSLITVTDLSTGLERKYEKAVGAYPEWSPDGQKIAFIDEERQLSILALDSGDVEKTEIQNAVPRDWSRDGRFLLVVDPRRDEKHEGLQLVNLQTGETQVVVKPYKHFITRFPRLSPDGSYVAFTDSKDEEKTEIFVQPIGSAQPIRITSHKRTDSNPLWLPDGKHILFMSNRLLGRWDLLSVEFHNGKPTGEPEVVVSDIGSNVTLHSCSQSGHLLYSKGDMRSEIFSTKVDAASGSISEDEDIVQLTDSEHLDKSPNWSRNGKHIAYYRQTPEFELVLCSMNSDGSNSRTLVRAKPFIGAMAWHPDNEHILYAGEEVNPENLAEQIRGVYSVSIRSRERKLVHQDPEFWGHMSLSPDAKQLVVISGLDQEYQLYAVDYNGEDRRILVTSNVSLDDSIWFPTFTPDGKEVIYTHVVRKDGKTSRSSIMAVSIAGGEPREIYANENPTDYVDGSGSTWLRDGRYVFDIRSNPGGRYHFALSLDGKSEPVKLSYKKGNSFRVSPDGTQAAFHKGKYNSKLWLMSGFLPDDELARK